ncbi:MAG: NYN domain-containing protein [Spirochaetes bacterium]|nr:NYN domain-containing protein [Spirochaetota bacterium]
MPYLIDGFNLLYKFPDCEALMVQNKLDDARIRLLTILKEYVKITGKKVRVVFDGKKHPLLEIKNETFGFIDVFYSLDYSADFLIKEFIKKDINPRMTTVVTSDNGIIDFVKKFGVRITKSEDFAEKIIKTIDEHYEQKIQEKDEDPIINPEEVQYWEEQFKKRR